MLYLPRLAFYEQVYATVLFFEYEVEVVFEIVCKGVGLARNRDGLALSRGRPLFNEVFDIVVVDVVCFSCLASGSTAASPTAPNARGVNSQWLHAGIDLCRSVSPYFITQVRSIEVGEAGMALLS